MCVVMRSACGCEGVECMIPAGTEEEVRCWIQAVRSGS